MKHGKARLLARVIVAFAALAGLVVATAWWGLRSSLPLLEGEIRASGLHSPVVVARDLLGVPTIEAQDRNDAAYALGFLHGQERFFQMDLLRRTAAGELSALLGPDVLEQDRESRRFRFRARAAVALERLQPQERATLDRYVAGVNEGLGRLNAPPFEYLLLRVRPEAWRAEDSLLVVSAMYRILQGAQESREFARGWLARHSTPEQLAVLLPGTSQFDAPLDGSTMRPDAPVTGSGPAWLARPVHHDAKNSALRPAQALVGSNSWAVAGDRSRHRGAIVANDMHLDIRLPNTWYRAVMSYPIGGTERRLVGLTLPGMPTFVIGSNREIAWAFTNSYGDLLDLVELEGDPSRPDRFKSERGWESISTHVEIIAVKGEADVTLKVEETTFGPVQAVGNRRYAVHWVALHPDAVNLGLFALESARDLETAFRAAARAGIPAQNITLADSSGRIGWTIAGALPKRSGSTDGDYPYRSTDAHIWRDLRLPADHPQIVSPPGGALWTANNRLLDIAEPSAIGDGGADLGARAQQIRDGLGKSRVLDESLLYRLALDDRALFADIWRDRALQVLTAEAIAGKPLRAEFKRLLTDSWTGRASPDSVGYRLARAYLHSLYRRLFGAVDAELAALPGRPDFMLASSRWPAVVLRLVTERPAAWLPQGQTWEQLELAAIDDSIQQLTADGRKLRDASWGSLNQARIAHPLAEALPVVGRWLSTPATPLAGDDHMPLISAPDFGQSERFVVSPGKEEHGLFNMPGGQSGHPLSPYFLAEHRAWLEGSPRPLLPQAERYRLTLIPSRR